MRDFVYVGEKESGAQWTDHCGHGKVCCLVCFSAEENLNAVIMIGKNRVKVRVEKDIEDIKFEESNYQTLENAFFKWKNIFSQDPVDIYSKVFNHF